MCNALVEPHGTQPNVKRTRKAGILATHGDRSHCDDDFSPISILEAPPLAAQERLFRRRP
jgi:hypothetical protein